VISDFLSGAMTGLAVAMPIGAIGTYLIGLAARERTPTAAAAALGVASVDGAYAIAAALAGAGVHELLSEASGWLTDRIDPRWLLLAYYSFRGVGLLLLPWLLADSVHPSMVVFIVVYGLDWVATVPPTVVLCRRLFGDQGTIVFGWVFASHQLGAAAAALTAGIIRDSFGTYTYAWFGGGALCALAAVLSIGLRRHRDVRPATADAGTRDTDIEAETVADLTP